MNRPDYIVWLETILKARGISQTDLAQELGVTHAALNRWLHEKAKPHTRTLTKIREFYQKYAFYSDLEKTFAITEWQKKFSSLKRKGSLGLLLHQKDFYEDSLLKLTYHSNKIEGSTLSLHETQSILFDNLVVPRHSLVEHLEVSNHRLAFQKMLESVQNNAPMTPDFILDLHRILMNGILTEAGQFRSHPVRIVGARVVPPNALKVPEKMTALCEQMQATQDPVGIIIQHALFETIHPFADGNGRIGRLLFNYQLLRADFPLIVIHAEKKRMYYEALEQAQVHQKFELLIKFIFEEMESDT
ncbi:MAG: Fic family protein [Deltaproteobacteria bacterium]|nr:Fic family protein [Deltaproteobacteria bacterium]